MAGKEGQDGADAPLSSEAGFPVITDGMVDAASIVLKESGLLDYWPDGAARLIVRDMLESASKAGASGQTGKRRHEGR